MKTMSIKKEAFTVSNWSGGTTTQLFIFPEHTELGMRNFDLRISSASFTTTGSKFSDFSGYTRFILPLKGRLSIRQPNRETVTLSPYQVCRFDGGEDTDSENSIDCSDFNLIVRHGVEADLDIWTGNQGEHPMKKGYTYFLYSTEAFLIHIFPADSSDHAAPSGKKETHFFEADALHILSPDRDTLVKTAETTVPIVVCKALLPNTKSEDIP